MAEIASPAAQSTSNSRASKYRPEIDGLRAFAVVAVIINHFNKDLLPSGYLGVDIFFVISGYVITSSLAGRKSKNFLDFLTGFYERRIKRLVPALVIFVLITSVLISLFNPDPGGALGLGWKSLLGVSNISLYRSSTDYFSQSTELDPFTHTWSLGVEEQFYLLFPFLIWFSGFGQQKAKGARNLFLSVGALTIASLIGFIYLYQVNQPAAYFLMPLRFWEMAAGSLIFIGFQKRAKIEQVLEQVPPLLVMAAMVGVMFLPVSAAVPVTIGIVLLSAILIACLKPGTAAYKFFTLEKVVFIGLISYSLYLWHWTVLAISRGTIGIHWWTVPIQVGLMVLMALLSYRWVEAPLRKGNWQWNRRINISIGAALISSSALFIAYGSKHIGQDLYLGQQGETLRRQEVSGTAIPCDYYRGRKEFAPDKDIPACSYESLTRGPIERSIYYIGNSHAGQLGGLITQMRQTRRLKQVILFAGGVKNPPLPLNAYPLSERNWIQKDINTQNLIRTAIIEIAKKGDLIIVGNSDFVLTETFWQSLPPSWKGNLNRSETMQAWRRGLTRLSEETFRQGTKLILLTPRPFFPIPSEFKENPSAFSTLHCGLLPQFKSNCALFANREQLIQETKEIKMFQTELSRRYKNVFVYDSFPALCPPKLKDCSSIVNGKVAYYDHHHLNNHGSALLSHSFKAFLKTNNLI